MIKGERGEKHRCLACNTAFFDLNRAPIVCPKCDEIFQVVEPVHSSPRNAGGFPNGARWRSLPPANEIDAVSDEEETNEQEAEEDAAPASSDDEIPEVGHEIPEIIDESPDADMLKEVM